MSADASEYAFSPRERRFSAGAASSSGGRADLRQSSSPESVSDSADSGPERPCKISGPLLLQTEQLFLHSAPELLPLLARIRREGQTASSDPSAPFNSYRIVLPPEACRLIRSALKAVVAEGGCRAAHAAPLLAAWEQADAPDPMSGPEAEDCANSPAARNADAPWVISGALLLETEQVIMQAAPELMPALAHIRRKGRLRSVDFSTEPFNLYAVTLPPETSRIIHRVLAGFFADHEDSGSHAPLLLTAWAQIGGPPE